MASFFLIWRPGDKASVDVMKYLVSNIEQLRQNGIIVRKPIVQSRALVNYFKKKDIPTTIPLLIVVEDEYINYVDENIYETVNSYIRPRENMKRNDTSIDSYDFNEDAKRILLSPDKPDENDPKVIQQEMEMKLKRAQEVRERRLGLNQQPVNNSIPYQEPVSPESYTADISPLDNITDYQNSILNGDE